MCDRNVEDKRRRTYASVMGEVASPVVGRIYRQGAISVGIVVHTNCVTAEHGPGVTSLMTSVTGKITPQIDAKANIASLLRMRADI